MINLFKNKKNEKRTKQSECTVYAFQYPLLRLSHCSKRIGKKANPSRSHQSDRRTNRMPHLLHHQRLRMGGVWIWKGKAPDMDGICNELLLRDARSPVRCHSSSPILGQQLGIPCYLWTSPENSSSKFHSIHSRLFHQRIHHEQDEDSV